VKFECGPTLPLRDHRDALERNDEGLVRFRIALEHNDDGRIAQLFLNDAAFVRRAVDRLYRDAPFPEGA